MNNLKIPRQHKFSISVSSDMVGGDLKMNNKTGQIFVQSKEGRIIHPHGLKLEHFYEGNRKKYLSRLVAGPNGPLTGISDCHFLSTYDSVYVIDTNEIRTEDGNVHNLTSFLRVRVEDDGTYFKTSLYERVGYFQFINLKYSSPEKAGWITLMQQDFFIEEVNAGLAIGIITDHDLDRLDDYNSRRLPLHDNLFVPERVKLMYATADKTDTLVNHLIHATDKLANIYKKNIEKNPALIEEQVSPVFDCDGYCFFNEKRIGMTLEPKQILKSKYDLNTSVKVGIESMR